MLSSDISVGSGPKDWKLDSLTVVSFTSRNPFYAWLVLRRSFVRKDSLVQFKLAVENSANVHFPNPLQKKVASAASPSFVLRIPQHTRELHKKKPFGYVCATEQTPHGFHYHGITFVSDSDYGLPIRFGAMLKPLWHEVFTGIKAYLGYE